MKTEILKEIDQYLSDNPKNYMGSGSILHQKVQKAIATDGQKTYTDEQIRRAFEAGYNLCDAEWRDKRNLIGFDDFLHRTGRGRNLIRLALVGPHQIGRI